jgi:hypothetical protein
MRGHTLFFWAVADWKYEREGRSAARGALDGRLATVPTRDAANKREPNPRSFGRPRQSTVCALEREEDP